MNGFLFINIYSTVTDLARFLGLSISHPLSRAMLYASNWSGMIAVKLFISESVFSITIFSL